MNNKPTTHVNPHGGSFWNIAGFALMLLAVSATSLSATSNYVYHEATTNNPGCGTDNYRSVLVPAANQALTIAFKAEYSTYHDQARVYYTTDGSTPAGAFGTGSGTTQVLVGTFSCTFNSGGIVDVVTATIPGQPYGTTVKYIVSAWHSGGGDEIFGNGCGDCGSPNNSSALATVFSYTLPQVGASMNFDGVDDYVDNGNMNFLNGSAAFTVEAWVRRTTNTINFPNIFSKSVPTGPIGWQANSINIGGWTAGNAGIYARVAGNSDAFGYNSTDNLLPLNTWAHVAVVYNGSGTTNADMLKIYVNGVSVSLTFSGTIPATAPVVDANATTGFILNSPHIWQGDMDELRVWNTARTCDEISQLYNCELTGNEDNLVAYYNFNQGLANEDNSSLTIYLFDSANFGGANDGILTNFALNGSTSNWTTPGGVTTGTSCSPLVPVAFSACPTGETVNTVTGTCAAPASYTATANADIAYLFTGATTGSGAGTGSGSTFNRGTTTVTLTATNACASTATCQFSVQVSDAEAPDITCPPTANLNTNNNLCTSTASIGTASATDNCTITLNNALHFDGGDDYATATVPGTFLGSNPLTIEFWAKNNSAFAFPMDFGFTWQVQFGGGTFYLSGFGLGAFNTGATVSTSGTVWEHFALTYDGAGTWKAYKNGLPTPTPSCTMAACFNNYSSILTNPPLRMGVGNNNYFYAGGLDEVRIWSVERTQSQIAANLYSELGGMETGLNAYYKFNQGTAGGNNTGITAATATTGNNAPLNNLNLNGATSNFIAGPSIQAVITNDAAAALPKGTTTVTWTATDGSGNTNSCQQTVNVTDNQIPVLTAPSNQSVNVTAGTCTGDYTIADPISDNCTGSTWSATFSGNANGNPTDLSNIADGMGSGPITFQKGTTTVVLSGADEASNAATTKTFTVTVVDNEVPTISGCSATNQNFNVVPGTCAHDYSIPAPTTLADNCPGTLTWNATFSGNTLGNPANLTAQTDGVASSDISFTKGATTVTLSATDAAGNTSTANCTFTVTVTDNEAPSLTCIPDVTVNTADGLCTAGALPTPTISDNCDGTYFGNALHLDGTNDVVVLDNNLKNALNGGTAITVEYWFKGTNLQSAFRFQDVSNAFLIAGHGATNPQHIISTDGNVNGVLIGNSVLDGNWHHIAMTWQKNTTNGFKSYVDGVVVAQRNSANVNLPVIAAPPTLGGYFAPGASQEYMNGALEEVRIWNVARTQAQIQAAMNSQLAGNEANLVAYYNFNQGTAGGNNAGITTLPDLATALGGTNNGTLNNFALNGATSNWVAYEGLTVSNDAPPLSQGTTTTVTWTVSDDAGNSSTCQQNVTVEDNELPVLTIPAANVNVNVTPGACTGDYTIADPIFDNCTGSTWSATFSGNALGNPTDISNIADGTDSGPITFQKGMTTVVLSGVDAVSNAATTVSFTVTVLDNEVPTISGCSATNQNFNVVPGTCAHDYSIPGPTTLTDNCPGTLTWNATFSGNPNGNPTNLTGQTIGVASGNIAFTRGVTTVTLSASDISGNTSTNNCTFTVTVIDDEVPSITCAADVTINTTTGLCTGTTTLVAPTVSDNCGIAAPTAPFSASDPNLKLWIDATTFSTTNGGGLAGIIEDNSAANRALTTTTTFETSGMNGKPVVRYNNNLTSVNAPFTSTNNTYLFMSVELVAFEGNWGAIFTHAPHDNGLQLEQNGLKTSNIFHWQTANDNTNVEQTIAYGTPYIMACKLESGNQRTFTLYQKDANGNLQNLGSASSSCCNVTLGSSYIYLGRSASNEYVNMRMGEFIYFQNTLPTTETNIVEYLSAKWLGTDLSNNAPAAFAKGTTTVTWTVADASDNTATCNQTVTVEDNELPVLTVPAANVNVNVSPGACTGDYTIADPIFDNCTGSTWSATFSGNALGNPTDISNINDGTGSGPITFQKGATTVVLSGVDAVSNAASTVSFTVTVVDNEVPTISGCSATNQNFNVVPGTCAHDYSIPGPTTLTDNCPGTLTWNATFSGNPNGNPTNLTGQTIGVASADIAFTRGITTVTLSASDISGNTSTANCTFTVTVIDDEVPSITCADDVTINTTTGLCTGTTILTNPTVADNCGGTLGNALHYAANDDEVTAPATGLPTGNSARTVEFWVKISNTLQNHIVSWGNFTCAIYSFGGVMRPHLWGSNNDVSSSTLSVPLNQWTHVAYVLTGTQIIFYVNGIPEAKNYTHNTASGGNLYIGSYFGATNETVDEVRIWNTVRTQVEIQNNMGAELVGNETGLVSYYKFNQGTANSNNAGITTLTATTGQNGTLSGFALNGTASNFVPGLSYPTFTSNAPATYAKGSNTVTWIATDASGNTSTCAQTVTVVDNQAPVLTAPSNQTLSAAAGACTQTYTIADPISDNCTGSTWSATFSGNTNGNPTDISNINDGTGSGTVTFQKGTTTVTLSGVDAASNAAATVMFTVTVTDNEVPTISGCATNQSFNIVPGTCAAPYSIPAPTTLADNCPGPLTWSAAFSGNSNGNPTNLTAQTDGAASGDISFTRGITTVTLSATDVSGNTSTANCSFTVTVIDDEVPSITCATDVTINTTTGLCTGTTTLTNPTISDNCSNTVAGNALSLDGSNDFLATPDLKPVIANTRTVELWFNAAAAGIIADERGQTPPGGGWQDSHIEILPNGDVKVRVWGLSAVTVGNVAFNTWHHVVLRYDASQSRLDGFLDGVQSASFSTGGVQMAGQFFLAFGLGDSQQLGSGGGYFNGKIDEIRIWNTARSASQIQANMNTELSLPQTGLVVYYKLNQGTAGGTNTGLTTATDDSGNAKHGTVANLALSGASSNWVAGVPLNGLTLTSNAPATYAKGSNTVTWTVTDASGNTSTCAQTVTVVDNELPVLTAPSNQNLSATAGGCTQTYTIADPISDNCTGSTWTYELSGATVFGPFAVNDGVNSPDLTFNLGVTTVTLTGVDASSNAAVTKTFTVTVADNIVPTVNACFGTNIAAFGQATGNSITQGSNSVYQSFTAPQTGVITSIQIQLGGGANGLTLQVGSGTACGGTVLGSKSFNGVSGLQTITFDTPIPVTGGVQYNFGILGNHTAGWATTGSYAGGQFYYNGCPGSPAFPNSDLVFTINMNYVPPISLYVVPGTCAQNYSIPAPTIADNCTGPLTWNATFSGNSNGNPSNLTGLADGVPTSALSFSKGVTQVVLNAVDVAGNISTTACPFTVTVIDDEVPGITCASDVTINTNSGLCTGTTTLIAPTVTDNCTGSGSPTNNAPATYAKGSNTVTWTVADASGNTASCAQMVTVVDNELPILTAPSNQNLTTATGTCAASYTIADPISDNCTGSTWSASFSGNTNGNPTDISNIADGTGSAAVTFQKGTTTVTLSGVDAASNAAATVMFTVTVTDDERPTISGCATNETLSTATGTCAQNYSIPAPTLADNCGGPLTWSAAFSGNSNGNPTNLTAQTDGAASADVPFQKGATTVTLSATDAAGNTSTVTCSFTVTVNDDEEPGITCADDVTINTTTGLCTGTTTLTEPTVTDNCLSGAGNALHFDGSNDLISASDLLASPPTQFTVEFWLNPASLSNFNQEISIGSAGSGHWAGFTFHTTSDGSVYVGTDIGSRMTPSDIPANTLTVNSWQHFAYTFGSGTGRFYKNGVLVATKAHNTPANFSFLRIASGCCHPVHGSMDELRIWNIQRTQAEIQANLSSELSGSESNLVAYYNFNQGNAGGSNTGLTTLIDLATNIGGANNGTLTGFALSGPTSNWVTGQTFSNYTLSNNAPATYAKGSNTVTWVATDASGNTASCAQMVTVVDNELPVLTAPSNQNLSAAAGVCSQTYTIADPISDNCTGSTWSASFSGNTNGNPTDISNIADGTGSGAVTFQKGTTTVVLSGVDAASNAAATVMFTVTVTDDERPTISGCATNQTLSTATGTCAQDYSIPAPTLADNCGGPLTWSAAFSGNSNGNPTNLTAQTDGAASANVPFQKGTTTVTLSATDAAGNTSTVTCSFTVTVNDDEEPGITCADDVTINTTTGLCTGTTTLIAPTVSDNCTGIGSPTNNAPATYTKGSNTVTWTVADASGNTSTCAQMVTVLDNELPTTTGCPSSQNLFTKINSCTQDYSIPAPTISDNCTGPFIWHATFSGNTNGNPTDLTGQTDGVASGNISFQKGTTTVTLSSTDVSGNVSTANCSFTVTVTDNVPPVVPTLSQINAICTSTPTAPTTTDNCAGTVTGTTGTTFPITALGITTITWTFDDGNGNTSTATQTVSLVCDTDQDGYNPPEDCDDSNPDINPGILEDCGLVGVMGVDDDCDGTTDEDLTDPVAVCQPLAVALNAAGMVVLGDSDMDNGSSDNCVASGNLTFATSPNSFDCDDAGPNTVTLTVSDPSGNSSACTAVVTVIDVLNYTETPGIRTASDGLANDKFGWGLGFDGGVMIVGAPDDKIGTQNKRGSAYVFLQNLPSADLWGQLKQLKSSDGIAVDYFGNAISVHSSTAVIGSHGSNVGALTDAGSVYVFEQNHPTLNNWGERKRISAPDAAAYAYFGNAVSLLGERAVIGASKHKQGSNSAQGAAYIFEKNTGGANNWGNVKKLIAADGAPNNFFGNSVTQIGDLVLVGANGNSNNRGAAYLFGKNTGGSGNWGQAQKLTASDAAVGDGFGTSVSMTSDYALIGAPNKATYSGAAYIFKNNAGTWSQLKKITVADGAINDRLGTSVELEGDYAYISAVRASGNAGAVYVFHKNVGGPDNWGQIGKYTATNGASGDQIGYSLGVSGEMLVFGANLDDIAAKADQGSVYVFRGEDCGEMSKPSNTLVSVADQSWLSPNVQCTPNPFTDELAIMVSAFGATHLTVTDAAGRLMSEADLPAGNVRFDLKTNEFRAGIYFVQVSSEAGVRVVPVALVR